MSPRVLASKLQEMSSQFKKIFTLNNKWVRSRRFGCLVTWFCYHLIAKPGKKTTTPSWPGPNAYFGRNHPKIRGVINVVSEFVVNSIWPGESIWRTKSCEIGPYSGPLLAHLLAITWTDDNWLYTDDLRNKLFFYCICSLFIQTVVSI